MTFRLLHAADLHVDAPFYGIASPPLAIADVCRRAPARALERLVDEALRHEVDAVCLAGDLFDARERSVRGILAFRKAFDRLVEGGVRVFVAHGNHDPLDLALHEISWPEGVCVFPGEVQTVQVKAKSGAEGTVSGYSYPVTTVTENIARSFPQDATGEFAVAVLHANVGDEPGHAPYAPCSAEDLRTAAMDYWALGHVHHRRTYRAEESVYAAYPGPLQGRSIREAGRGGALLVDVDQSVRIQAIPLAPIAWREAEVHLDGEEGVAGLHDRLLDAVDTEVSEPAPGLEGTLMRLTLKGRGPAHAALSQGDALAEHRQSLQEALADRDPFVWVVGLEDRTRPEIDVEGLAEQESFVGDVVRFASELTAMATEPSGALPSEATAIVADLYQNRRVDRLLSLPDQERWQSLVERALDDCLAALLPPERI